MSAGGPAIRVAVVGALGRMGSQVCAAVEAAPDLELTARIDAGDDLAVKFQDQSQHAVRGRMLRSKIDGEIAKILFVHGQAFGSAFSSPGSG